MHERLLCRSMTMFPWSIPQMALAVPLILLGYAGCHKHDGVVEMEKKLSALEARVAHQEKQLQRTNEQLVELTQQQRRTDAKAPVLSVKDVKASQAAFSLGELRRFQKSVKLPEPSFVKLVTIYDAERSKLQSLVSKLTLPRDRLLFREGSKEIRRSTVEQIRAELGQQVADQWRLHQANRRKSATR